MSAVMIEEYPMQLFETNMFKPFSQKDFNDRMHINQSAKYDMNDAAKSIGELLKKHQLLDLLGVCNIHNHFHVNENEIIVAKTNAMNTVPSFDADVSSLNYVHLKATTLAASVEKDSIPATPYMWAYDKQSKMFFALQFFSGNQEMSNRFHRLAERSKNLLNFYQEFIELAGNLALEDILGIYLLYDDLLDERRIHDEFYETTNDEAREQWIYAKKLNVNQKQNAAITHWAFSTDNNDVIQVLCNAYCPKRSNGDHEGYLSHMKC
ncbi:unnamed protein product [Adineta steineri]|uniref:Uncharacterized protein n=1 Tax=Adineta steineri TaxID=433720 RepID=A0A815S6P3_9BILA|nr:unnamed protein product [Adineta steineri]CAF4188856.1 unnamed protein product [Adineta steineri]